MSNFMPNFRKIVVIVTWEKLYCRKIIPGAKCNTIDAKCNKLLAQNVITLQSMTKIFVMLSNIHDKVNSKSFKSPLPLPTQSMLMGILFSYQHESRAPKKFPFSE